MYNCLHFVGGELKDDWCLSLAWEPQFTFGWILREIIDSLISDSNFKTCAQVRYL